MNQIKAVILAILLTVTLCACGSAPSADTEISAASTVTDVPPTPETTVTPTAPPETTAPNDGTNSLNAIGDIDIESGVFNVTITIPAEYVGETSQAELDESIIDNDYKSATLNDDGSVTYVMSKSKHEELMREYREQINQSLSDMLQSGNYPSFTSIETNDDFTEFTVYMNTDSPGLSESFSVLAFYMYGGIYNHFNGTPVENVHVVFINETTGEVVDETNSTDMS